MVAIESVLTNLVSTLSAVDICKAALGAVPIPSSPLIKVFPVTPKLPLTNEVVPEMIGENTEVDAEILPTTVSASFGKLVLIPTPPSKCVVSPFTIIISVSVPD